MVTTFLSWTPDSCFSCMSDLPMLNSSSYLLWLCFSFEQFWQFTLLWSTHTKANVCCLKSFKGQPPLYPSSLVSFPLSLSYLLFFKFQSIHDYSSFFLLYCHLHRYRNIYHVILHSPSALFVQPDAHSQASLL